MDGDRAPPSLRPIQPYLMVCKQFTKRDPIVSYYAMMCAVQEGISAAKTDPEGKTFLLTLMDRLESMKRSLAGEEALKSEVVAQAHVEAVGLKLFEYADSEDRKANFHKNMVKAFFTSSHVFSILKSIGELSEEIEAKQKYAKWKAVEIDRCLKNGIPPTPGPPGEGGAELSEDAEGHIVKPTPKPRQHPAPGMPTGQLQYPTPGLPTDLPQYPTGQPQYPTGQPQFPTGQPQYPIGQPQHLTPGIPTSQPQYPTPDVSTTSSEASGEAASPEDVSQAQKLCKFASSALDYDDVTGAVDYLTRALQLLKKH